MIIEEVHDAQLLSIEHHDFEKRLTLRMRSDRNLIYDLTFEGVVGWLFTPFEIQNILFDAKVYSFDNVPSEVWEDWDGLKSYSTMVENSKASIAVLNPSVGFGGVILFTGPDPFKKN